MLTRKTADIEDAFTHFFLHYSGSKKFAIKNSPVINVDSTVYQEEPRDMPEYPVENKKDSDSEDYIENLLKEIRDQDNYNEEPSKEITPKVNPKWQGNAYFIYFYLDYFFKCNYIF